MKIEKKEDQIILIINLKECKTWLTKTKTKNCWERNLIYFFLIRGNQREWCRKFITTHTLYSTNWTRSRITHQIIIWYRVNFCYKLNAVKKPVFVLFLWLMCAVDEINGSNSESGKREESTSVCKLKLL